MRARLQLMMTRLEFRWIKAIGRLSQASVGDLLSWQIISFLDHATKIVHSGFQSVTQQRGSLT